MTDDLIRILAEDGTADPSLEPQLHGEDLRKLYRLMVLNRHLDERMIMLQRQGRIGFYIASTGEEAAILGSAFAMRQKDWIVPCYREVGAALLRGLPLRTILCQIFGNAEDLTKGRQMPCHYASRQLNYLSISSPVGTQIPHAVGLAWAARMRGDDVVVLVYFGDGATSEGDFHVGMNFAGVFKAPVIFLCRNNQWAISLPRERQTASRTIAIKASAYGFEGVRVDGNDVLAVYHVTRQAAEKARSGGGPTLIEAVTYRIAAHSTSDDPRLYLTQEKVAELELWRKRDPILRFRRYLERKNLWSEAEEEELHKQVDSEIVRATKEVEKIPPPPLESMFEDVYAEVPWHLKEQRQELLAEHREVVVHDGQER